MHAWKIFFPPDLVGWPSSWLCHNRRTHIHNNSTTKPEPCHFHSLNEYCRYIWNRNGTNLFIPHSFLANLTPCNNDPHMMTRSLISWSGYTTIGPNKTPSLPDTRPFQVHGTSHSFHKYHTEGGLIITFIYIMQGPLLEWKCSSYLLNKLAIHYAPGSDSWPLINRERSDCWNGMNEGKDQRVRWCGL